MSDGVMINVSLRSVRGVSVDQPQLVVRCGAEECASTMGPDASDPEMNEVLCVFSEAGAGAVTVEVRELGSGESKGSGELDVGALSEDPSTLWVNLSGGAAVEVAAFVDQLAAEGDLSGGDEEVEAELAGVLEEEAGARSNRPQDQEEGGDLGDELTMELEDPETAEFMAIKPFIGAICPPSDAPAQPDLRAPDADLELEFAQGYRAHDARDNLFYTTDGRIVYTTAALGVVMDVESRQQAFFRKHDDDIVSLAYHPGRNIAATGQMGKTPSIWVWDVSTLEPIAELKGLLQREIVSLDFNSTGDKLVAVGKDNDHTIAVYDLRTKRAIASAAGNKNMVFGAKFVPGDDSQVVSVGIKHIKFWSVGAGSMRARTGVTGNLGEVCSMVGLGFKGKFCLAGTANGDLYIWNGNRLAKNVKGLHQGPIFAVSADEDNVFTGGRDGVVQVLDTRANPVGKVQFETAVRSVSSQGDKILVGTLSGIAETDKSCSPPKQIIDAHAGELWGLAVHPVDEDLCVTCADEGRIMMWSQSKRSLVKSANLRGEEARCLNFNSDGTALVVGCKSGAFYVLDEDLNVTFSDKRAHRQEISDVKFSPDDMSLAVGSHDNTVTLWDVTGPDSLDQRGRCRGHSSYITHLDWDVDSTYLQTNCGAYELLFWDAFTGDQITASSSLRDTEWATWTCTLGWPVQAIWDKFAKGCDVKAVDRAKNRQVIATGEGVSGLLKLLRYPCTGHGYSNRGALNLPRPDYKAYLAHSSFVTNARFNADDSKLYSVGGADRTLLQWVTTF